jgi:hypothetical protein
VIILIIQKWRKNMRHYIKTSKLILAIALLSIPAIANTANAKTNLKTSSGKEVVSMDKKFFNERKPIHRTATTINDWPNDWKWERKINPDKPLFNQLDQNTNGEITKEEFRSAVINDKEDRVFAALDKNKNESISRSELDKFSAD